ncbi:tyrosine-protein phosphatase [Viscerimonas tarda]
MKRFYVVLCILVSLLASCSKTDKNTGIAFYEGEDISDVASIIRNKETKVSSLVINVGGKWVLYSGASVDKIDYSEPIAGGFEAGRHTLNVSDSSRVYFQLITDRGRGILAERRLPMAGGYNFRDLGGIRNNDGKYIKWGQLFRSDDLYKLSESDLNYLSSNPIVSLVDFRTDEEVKSAPDKVPASVKSSYHLPIDAGSLSMEELAEFSIPQMDSIMMSMNVKLVSDSLCVKQYREFFGILQNEKNIPVMFHCSAGKDRTGMGTALVLFALNVDEKVILEDYLASAMYLGDKYADITNEYPNLKPLYDVKPEFLLAGIEQLKKSYGSPENYLKKVLHVDIDLFRQKYLY